jgi:hypothetical protein
MPVSAPAEEEPFCCSCVESLLGGGSRPVSLPIRLHAVYVVATVALAYLLSRVPFLANLTLLDGSTEDSASPTAVDDWQQPFSALSCKCYS